VEAQILKEWFKMNIGTCIEKVNTCKLNYLPHRNKIFVNVWALQKYLIQELAHQCDVWDYLAEKISSVFSSNLVVHFIKIDFKCSCDNEIRYLDLTYFSELRHSKEAVRCFLVAVFRTLALQERVKHFLVALQRIYALPCQV
jgi:hypothetical protein